MPKFKLPALKEPKETEMDNAIPYDPVENDSWYRTVRIPANKAIIDSIAVGDSVTITLNGKIVSTEARESEKGKPRIEFEIEISDVQTEGDAGMEDLADD